MQSENKKILIIAAHPDDEVLGCGGTAAKYVKMGHKAYCLFLGGGKKARNTDNASLAETEQMVLRQEAEKANQILGISKVFFENFPDQEYDSIPLLKIIQAIEKVKKQIKPDIVFTHHSNDLNKDHQIVFEAVMTACRPLAQESVKKIYSFEVSSSTEWGVPVKQACFAPNIFVDISDDFHKKTQALEAYKSEIREYPHPRSVKGIKIIAQRWGLVVNKRFAEAFELIREIKD